MVEVQCSSCHTRYRIDEQVLPEGTPTFKCSRCGHVFSLEPRGEAPEAVAGETKADTRSDSSPSEQNGLATANSVNPPVEKVSPADSRRDSQAAIRSGKLPSEAPPTKSLTQELISRPIRTRHEESAGGESLTFDFRDEPAPLGETATPNGVSAIKPPADGARTRRPAVTGWEVGEVPENIEAVKPGTRFKIGAAEFGNVNADPDSDDVITEDDFVDESSAPVYNRGVTHSARFVVGLLFIVGVCFAAATLAIHNAPAAALGTLTRIPILGERFPSPITPARMVALRNVRASYQRSRDGGSALIIQGDADNVSGSTLHTIKIAASLGPANLDQREVYCGNNLATRTVSQMTLHEIEFFQKLNPPRDFALGPSASSPFVIVFPNASSAAQDFTLAVSEARPASTPDSMAAQ